MKLIIAGTRSLKTTPRQVCDFVLAFKLLVSEVVSGCGGMVDRCGESFAQANSIPINPFPAQWQEHGKSAGPIRNRDMAKYADALLLIWDGESRGSKNMRDEMMKVGKPIYEVILRKP